MGTPWTFSVMCPQGHLASQSVFDRSTLESRVRRHAPIPLQCQVCRRQWEATAQQRRMLSLALANDSRLTRARARRSANERGAPRGRASGRA